MVAASVVQAAHAYDAAARSIRGASAICNFPESDDERRNAVSAAHGGHVPFIRPAVEGVNTRASMPRRGSSQLDEDGSPRDIPIVTGRPGGRPGTRAAAAAAAKAVDTDSAVEEDHPAAALPRPKRIMELSDSAAPIAAASAAARQHSAAAGADHSMGASPMLGCSPMLGLGVSPALMGVSPVLPGMGHGPGSSWGQLPLPGSLGLGADMPADFLTTHTTDFNMGVGSFDAMGSFPNMPGFPGSLGKATANMTATAAAASGFGAIDQPQGPGATKIAAAASVSSILEDDGENLTLSGHPPGVSCPVGGGVYSMEYHDEYEDDLMGQMEVDDTDGSGSGDLSGCSPGTAAVFEELMMGTEWAS